MSVGHPKDCPCPLHAGARGGAGVGVRAAAGQLHAARGGAAPGAGGAAGQAAPAAGKDCRGAGACSKHVWMWMHGPCMARDACGAARDGGATRWCLIGLACVRACVQGEKQPASKEALQRAGQQIRCACMHADQVCKHACMWGECVRVRISTSFWMVRCAFSPLTQVRNNISPAESLEGKARHAASGRP